MKCLVLLLILLSSAYGQLSIPGLQFIQPDPVSGRPLLVQTPCAHSDEFWGGWAVPSLVFSNSEREVFIDNACIEQAVIFDGFPRSQRYMVALYTRYKEGSVCKIFLEASRKHPEIHADIPELMRECRQVFYKYEWAHVDTGKKEVQFSHLVFLDRDGHHFMEMPNKKAFALSSLDPWEQSMFARIAALIERRAASVARRIRP